MSEVFQVGAGLFGADMHSKNAAALRREARTAASQGYRDEEAQRRESRQFMGLAGAALAENGGTGVQGDAILRQSEMLANLDALNVRYGGLQRARGIRQQARQESSLSTQSLLSTAGSLFAAFDPSSNTRTILGV